MQLGTTIDTIIRGPKPLANPEKTKKDRALKAAINPVLIRRELNTRHLYEFVKYFWDVVSNDDFQPNWHIKYLCEELEKVAENVGNNVQKEYDVIINIPPGMTKTIICSIMYPAWCWTKWFWMRFITGGYSSTLSLEAAESSRDLIMSEKFIMLYPELAIKDDKKVKSNFKIVRKHYRKNGFQPQLINGGNRYSTSVGGTLTGFHAHIQIIDDPLDPRRSYSEVELRKTNRWCDQTLSTRKCNKKTTVLIVIMQRLHQDDPSGHLLKKKGKKIKHICLPGEIAGYEQYVSPKDLISNYKNNLLDPNRLGWNELKEMEADLGQYGYAGQVGQNPTPPGGGMFKVDHFQIIDNLPASVNFVDIYRYWDKAGTADGGCRTAGVKMIKCLHGRWIVVDVKLGQWASEERERIIKETANADGPNVKVGIEQEPGSGGKESAESTIRNLAGFFIQKDRPHGDKVYRADPYSVQVNEGNVQLLRGDWNTEYIEEHRFFPFGKFKDQVDASAAAFNIMAGKREAKGL
jgi:predicted phage terminase large subunit-like protein